MISMIAHQWRQPISTISMRANNILVDVSLKEVNDRKLEKIAGGIMHDTQELSKTIDDFRNFFKPDNKTVEVIIEDIFNDVFLVIGKSLVNNNIAFKKDLHSTKKIKTFPRELMQCIINVIQNAKDAILENHIKDGLIHISSNDTDYGVEIKILDNGGGIKDEVIDKIFEPYFSTKHNLNGTGIGLYMTKMIIEEHLSGTIIANNSGNGAYFEIYLPELKDENSNYIN